MTCGGCSGAIDRVLKKTEGAFRTLWLLTDAHLCSSAGISTYDVSLEKQEVLVTGTIPYDDLLAKIQKTGKEVSSGCATGWIGLTCHMPRSALGRRLLECCLAIDNVLRRCGIYDCL